MNIIKRYKKKKEMIFIYKEVIIKSISEYSDIDEKIKKSLLNKIELTMFDNSISCLLNNFSLFYEDGIFEMCIPSATLYDTIEKNIGLHYTIINITYNKFNRWLIIQFI